MKNNKKSNRNNKKPNNLVVYIDGGARGNPGPAGAGVVICDSKEKPIKKYSQYLGDNLTNNKAEYQSLLFALKKIKLLYGKKQAKQMKIKIKSDSDLLVKQLRGEYKIKHDNIKPLFLKAWNLKIDFGEIVFNQVRREKNKLADDLVNQALDEKQRKQKLL